MCIYYNGKQYTRSRRKLFSYIDSPLQLKIVLFVVILVTVESFIVIGGFLYVKSIVKFVSPVENLISTFLIASGIFVTLTVVNILISIFFSSKITGPLYNFQERMKEVSMGNLGAEVVLREKDELQDLEAEFNSMLFHLRKRVNDNLVSRNEIMKYIEELEDKIKQGNISENLEKECLEVIANIKEKAKLIGTSFFNV